jgi:uncharacterized membrane protein
MAQLPRSSSRRVSDDTWYAELEQLVQRHEQGEISDEQFASAKQRILRQSRHGRGRPEQLQVVTAVYDDEHEARAIYGTLRALQRDGLGKIVDAAVLRRDASGAVHLTEYDELAPRGGAAPGELIATLAGLVFPPTMVFGAAAGAAASVLLSHLSDLGFDDRELRALGGALKPGQSAIFAVAQTRWSGELAGYLGAPKSFSTYALPRELVTLVSPSVGDACAESST